MVKILKKKNIAKYNPCNPLQKRIKIDVPICQSAMFGTLFVEKRAEGGVIFEIKNK